ncbi:MAG: NAD-dependent deacylase [Promethearchaeati archaeon SRVP18_Atabeyarchaeia-1]
MSRKKGEADNLIAKAAKIIMDSKKLVVLTGAGISTESGIPDFRSPGGLWSKYDPMKVASIGAFRSDPKSWWIWALSLGPDVLDAKPNKAHVAIAELEKMGKVNAVVTQNIDGLHQKAGNVYVLELHGSMATASCTRCGARYPREEVMELVKMGENPPMCDLDAGILKPDIVLFGEPLPPLIFQEATKKSMECDVMLIVGSSLVVYPAAVLPKLAKDNGAKMILVNMEPTEMDDQCDVVIHEKAGDVMLKIVSACRALTAKT